MATIDQKTHTQIHRLNIASASIFALLAVAAGIFMKNTSFPWVIGHVTKDALQSQTNTVFAPAIHSLIDVNLKWLVVVIMALAAVFSLLTITRWHDKYHEAIKNHVRPMRWLEFGLTLGLMVEAVGMLFGIQDVAFLKIMVGLVIIMSGMGWMAERQNLSGKKTVWSAFIFSLAAGLLAWLPIKLSLLGTWGWGLIRLPWYTYAVDVLLFLGFVLIWLNLYYGLKRFKSWQKYELVERNYLVVNLAVKLAFGLVLIIGLKK